MNRDFQSVPQGHAFPESQAGSAAQAVFVTGASGFIGRHIVRSLINRGYSVRVLARRKPEGRKQPVRVVLGDLIQPESFARELQGVSSVIHAALTDDLSHDLEATSELYRLSAEAGVRRFLHLSTISVYGNPADGAVTEETSPIPSTDAYSRIKLALELALSGASPACPEVAILRLGCVYGPGGGWWTQGLLDMMARGKLILVNGGTGYANLIHVEDVAAIILLLLARSNPPFDVYNVTDGEPVAWSRYYSELEKIFRHSATVSMSAAEARAYGKKWLRPSLLRRVIRKVAGSAITHPLDDRAIDGFASRAVYSNEKALRTLGFRPAHDFDSGIRSVRAELDSRANQLAGPLLART
jgi:nucleoside-diphosphate-sugar epimerase